MKKIQYSVELTLIDGSTTVTLADADGKGAGSAAYSQITARKDVHVQKGGILYIPFHSILMAVVTASQVEVDAPTDAFCETEEPEEP